MKLKGVFIFLVIMCLCVGCSKETSEVNVIAAASLTESFDELKTVFEEENPDVEINLVFAGSQDCVAQIKEGASYDVFASANVKYMDEMIAENYIEDGSQSTFATNKLAVITYKDVEGIDSIEDIIEKDVTIVIADETVPVGKYTLQVLDDIVESGVYEENYKDAFLNKVVSYETNVKSVATKVAMGEADLGIVYMTDIVESIKDDVNIVDIPMEYNVVAEYPIAVIGDEGENKAASDWVEFILSDEGQNILNKYGFE